MTTTSRRRVCGVRHPSRTSFYCQKDPGHAGVHQGRRGRVSRQWEPYLAAFAAMTGGLR